VVIFCEDPIINICDVFAKRQTDTNDVYKRNFLEEADSENLCIYHHIVTDKIIID